MLKASCSEEKHKEEGGYKEIFDVPAQGLHTNVQNGNLQVLFLPCLDWGKQLHYLGRFPNGNGREAHHEQGWT